MNIEFENVNFNSRSGPNGFGLKLARYLISSGHDIARFTTNDLPEVRLTFIQGRNDFKPNVLRLDGIYFNSEQDWKRMNGPIKASYDFADAVIVQSEFDKELTLRYFGDRENIHVIRNGTNVDTIMQAIPDPMVYGIPRDKIWLCASSWRPHKRLRDNIRLFLELSEPDAIMIVAGANAEEHAHEFVGHPKLIFVGDLTWEKLISVMRAAGHFVHLSWLDHCPNVVVDANAAGCQIYCSSAGGTKEIAGQGATIVDEEEWDFEPTELYKPPPMTFNLKSNEDFGCDVSIHRATAEYIEVLRSVLS